MGNKVSILLFVVLAIFFISLFLVISADIKSSKYKLSNSSSQDLKINTVKIPTDLTDPPTGLGLPFETFDISFDRGTVVPFGVVRNNSDDPTVGYQGIGFPLKSESDVLAVAPGKIVAISDEGDDYGGETIVQFLEDSDNTGKGWVFIYKQVNPFFEIDVGSSVRKGQKIALKNSRPDYSAHFQLAYADNNFQDYKYNLCWIENLDSHAKAEIDSFWTTYLETTPLEDNWKNLREDTKFPYRKLVDLGDYPQGPQLCYQMGTDVR